MTITNFEGLNSLYGRDYEVQSEIMVKCLAKRHKFHDRDSNPHSKLGSDAQPHHSQLEDEDSLLFAHMPLAFGTISLIKIRSAESLEVFKKHLPVQWLIAKGKRFL